MPLHASLESDQIIEPPPDGRDPLREIARLSALIARGDSAAASALGRLVGLGLTREGSELVPIQGDDAGRSHG